MMIMMKMVRVVEMLKMIVTYEMTIIIMTNIIFTIIIIIGWCSARSHCRTLICYYSTSPPMLQVTNVCTNACVTVTVF